MSQTRFTPKISKFNRPGAKPEILGHWQRRNFDGGVVTPYTKKEREPNFPNTPGGALARLAWKLGMTLDVTTPRLKTQIDKFVTIAFAKARTKSHYAKVNTYNEVTAPEMTIRVFMKYLHILEPRKVVLSLEFTDQRGKVVEVEEKIDYIYGNAPEILNLPPEYKHDNDIIAATLSEEA